MKLGLIKGKKTEDWGGKGNLKAHTQAAHRLSGPAGVIEIRIKKCINQ